MLCLSRNNSKCTLFGKIEELFCLKSIHGITSIGCEDEIYPHMTGFYKKFTSDYLDESYSLIQDNCCIMERRIRSLARSLVYRCPKQQDTSRWNLLGDQNESFEKILDQMENLENYFNCHTPEKLQNCMVPFLLNTDNITCLYVAAETRLIQDTISGIEIPEQFEVVDFVVRNPEEFVIDPVKNLNDYEGFNYLTIFIVRAIDLNSKNSWRNRLLNDLLEHQYWATVGERHSMFVPLFIADNEQELESIPVAALPFSFVLTEENLFIGMACIRVIFPIEHLFLKTAIHKLNEDISKEQLKNIIEALTTWAPLMLISYFFKNNSFIDNYCQCALTATTIAYEFLKHPFQKKALFKDEIEQFINPETRIPDYPVPIDTPIKKEDSVNWYLFAQVQTIFQKLAILNSFKLAIFPAQQLGEQLLNLDVEYLSCLVHCCDFDPIEQLCTKYEQQISSADRQANFSDLRQFITN